MIDEQIADVYDLLIIKCQWCNDHPGIGSITILRNAEARGYMNMICASCGLKTKIIFEPGCIPKQMKGAGLKIC